MNTDPLNGVMVVEFCQVAAGPFCGMLLADMGAEVVKVESGAGDSMRQWPPFTDGYSENFASVNRNKRSIKLDLKSDAGRTAALALIAKADVVIENNRPGVMDRLGLGWAAVSKDRPDLVYCSISAFGQSGPRAEQGGFDLTVQGMSGVMSVTGEPGGAPVKCGVPISDFSAGLYGAFAVSSYLQRVRAGGPGGHIDISMMAATLGIAALQTSEYFGSGQDPRKLGSAHPRNAPYQAFKAEDGYFVMAAGNDKLWASVCSALGREDLAQEERFSSTARRAEHQAEIKGIIEAAFASRTTADAVATFEAAGVPCGPINTYSQALGDPQIEEMGFVQEIELPGGARVKTFGSPIRVSGETLAIRQRPPGHGEHTDEILAELGLLTPKKERRA